MSEVCDVPVVSTVCDTASDASASLVAAPFDWLADAMGQAAGWMFESMWQVFDTTTFVDVTSSEFTGVYNILFGIAVFMTLGFFVLQVIGAMVRRETAALSRAALGMAKSILGSFVALTLLAAALEITDRLCIAIVHAAGTTMDEMGDRIALLVAGLSGLTIAAPGVGTIVTIFIGSLAVGAAAMVWISLLIRKALLLIAIVFAPIALAGASWDHTRGWVSKWLSFVLALIVSKVVIVVIFLLATAQVSAPIDADLQSLSDPMAGIVLMLLAGFAPYLSYKAISFMGFDSYHAMSAEQEAKGALHHPLPTSLGGGRIGQAPKVLDAAGDDGGTPATGSSAGSAPKSTPSSAHPGTLGGVGEGGGLSETGAASGGAGGGAAGAAAGGAVLAGAVLAQESATAGPRLGATLDAKSSKQADQASEPAPAPPPPAPLRVADPLPPAPRQPDQNGVG